MPALRVCHLGKYYPPAPGGIESHVRTLAQAQAALGVDVQVYCINHEPGSTVSESDGPMRLTRFGRAASAAKLDVCPDLRAALAHLQADLVHLHVPNPTMILALLGSHSRTPLVVTYHSDLIGKRIRGALFRPLERLAYRRARAILPTSPLYAAGSHFLRAYADRLHVLPHGIDLAPYVEPSAEDRREAEEIRAQYPGPLWVGCGRLVAYKGFINAIRALTRVRGTLLLIGEGPDQHALQHEAARLGVRERVVFLGHLPRVVPCYLAAEAFWLPSNARSEAFGLVQVEAMASGCPVINTHIPHSGVVWVSRHEETGLTVPVNDPVALADAANRLLSEPGLRDRLAAAARVRAVAEFDHRTMAERSLAVYRDVLASEPGARESTNGAWLAGERSAVGSS